MYRFRATIEEGRAAGNSWSYVAVPPDIAAALGGIRRLRGTTERVAFEAALRARGAGFKAIVIAREIRDAVVIEAGHEIEIERDVDARSRPIELPPAREGALKRRPGAGRAFAELTPSHQREYAQWIGGSNKDTTKASRVDRALEMIVAKQHVE